MLEKENKLGNIRFSRNVIMRIVEHAIDDCDNRVTLENYKGKYVRVMASNNVEIEDTEQGINITVYIVLRFGTSLKKYTKLIIDRIYQDVESIMGERPQSVKLIVTGIRSKNTIKRHIEII